LRPTRSDSRPVSGEHANCAIENDATSNPAVAGDAPASRAYRARTGNRIPKPMRSRATVVQMTPKPGGRGFRAKSAVADLGACRCVGHLVTQLDQLIAERIGTGPVLGGASLVALARQRGGVLADLTRRRAQLQPHGRADLERRRGRFRVVAAV